MKSIVKIGTRKSRLALIQTNMVCDALRKAHPALAEEGAIEVVHVVTSGDKSQASGKALCDKEGGKALFAKELEDALFSGSIDMAVHSMKDMPGVLPKGLFIPALLPRADVRDAFFSKTGGGIDDLPKGAVVGTAGPRRKALILAKRSDVSVQVIRGNVETRLQKIEDGEFDATFLAVAGLDRLGLRDRIQNILEPDEFLPAAGQGAVGVEIRENDVRTHDLLKPLHCSETGLCVAAERGFLRVIDGTCKTPVAALAVLDKDEITLSVLAARMDGSEIKSETARLKISNEKEAENLGVELAQKIRSQIPDNFFE